jgi:protein subunit release factor B
MPFRDDEIEISFYKSRGPGGQKKNVTESAVRVRHIPTGLIVTATESRSQHRNKAAALEELERRLALRRRRRKRRVATKPTAASRRRHAETKRKLARKKQLRQMPELDD